MGRVDHRVSRVCQRLQCRHGQTPIPCGVSVKVAAVSLRDGVSDLVDHGHGVIARSDREAAFSSARAVDMKREIVPR